MSRTYRRTPFSANKLRRPKTKQERTQLEALKTEMLDIGYNVSPKNRINRFIPNDRDDIKASSTRETY